MRRPSLAGTPIQRLTRYKAVDVYDVVGGHPATASLVVFDLDPAAGAGQHVDDIAGVQAVDHAAVAAGAGAHVERAGGNNHPFAAAGALTGAAARGAGDLSARLVAAMTVVLLGRAARDFFNRSANDLAQRFFARGVFPAGQGAAQRVSAGVAGQGAANVKVFGLAFNAGGGQDAAGVGVDDAQINGHVRAAAAAGDAADNAADSAASGGAARAAGVFIKLGDGGNDQQLGTLDFTNGRSGFAAYAPAGAQVLFGNHVIHGLALQHDEAAGVEQGGGQHVGHAVTNGCVPPLSGRAGLVFKAGHCNARLGAIVGGQLGVGHARAAAAVAHVGGGAGRRAAGQHGQRANCRKYLEFHRVHPPGCSCRQYAGCPTCPDCFQPVQRDFSPKQDSGTGPGVCPAAKNGLVQVAASEQVCCKYGQLPVVYPIAVV